MPVRPLQLVVDHQILSQRTVERHTMRYENKGCRGSKAEAPKYPVGKRVFMTMAVYGNPAAIDPALTGPPGLLEVNLPASIHKLRKSEANTVQNYFQGIQ